jgi:hypothetical protein
MEVRKRDAGATAEASYRIREDKAGRVPFTAIELPSSAFLFSKVLRGREES